MAYIVPTSTRDGQFTTDITSFTPDFGPYVAGDLLIVCWSKDDAVGGVITIADGSWTFTNGATAGGGQSNVGTSGTNTVRGGYNWIVASSSSETLPTITSTDSDSWCYCTMVVRGAPATNPMDVIGTNTDSVWPYLSNSVTTTSPNCLVVVTAAVDGGVAMTALPGIMNLSNKDSGSDSLTVAWTYKRVAGATGTREFYGTGSADETVFHTFAIKDASGGALIDGYTDASIGTIITTHRGAGVFTGETFGGNLLGYEILPTVSKRGPASVLQMDLSPLGYVDYTTAANNATGGDVIPFPAVEAIGDAFMIGDTSQFFTVLFNRTGAVAGVAGVVLWEYYAIGGVWKALPNVYDQTGSFNNTALANTSWPKQIASDWTSQTINGLDRFWVRSRITTVYTTNPTISQIWVGDTGTLFDALTALADTGVNPFESRLYSSPAIVGSVLSGAFFQWSATHNLSASSYLLTNYIFANPRDSIDAGREVNGGVHFTLRDTNATYRIRGWVVGASDTKVTRPAKWNNVGIQLSTGGRFFDEAGFDSVNVRGQLIAPNNQFGACFAAWGNILKVGKLQISGGGSSLPIPYEGLQRISDGYPVAMIDENTAYIPIKIGGADSVNLQWQFFYLQFPGMWADNPANVAWRVNNQDVGLGIEIDTQAGDVCKMLTGTITSTSYWKFDILVTASASAEYDFTGLTLIGSEVTLRPVTNFSEMTFVDCDMQFSGCELTDCKISAPPSTNNIMATTVATYISGGTIDVSTLGAGVYLTSTDTPDIFSSVFFQSNGEFTYEFEDGFTIGTAGHAFRLTAPGTYELDGLQFRGFGAVGSTSAAIFNDSGGLITLQLVNGSSYPTVRNGAGASTVITQATTVTITGMRDNTEVRILDNATSEFLAGIEAVVDGTTDDRSFSFTLAVGTIVDIAIFNVNFILPPNNRIENYVVPTTNASLPVSQVRDRNYVNL